MQKTDFNAPNGSRDIPFQSQKFEQDGRRPSCQAIFHQHQPMVSMHLNSFTRCCSNYSDFLLRHRALVTRLLSQGYRVNRLSNTFKKFYGRHTDLVGQYKKNVCQMFADSIS